MGMNERDSLTKVDSLSLPRCRYLPGEHSKDRKSFKYQNKSCFKVPHVGLRASLTDGTSPRHRLSVCGLELAEGPGNWAKDDNNTTDSNRHLLGGCMYILVS